MIGRVGERERLLTIVIVGGGPTGVAASPAADWLAHDVAGEPLPGIAPVAKQLVSGANVLLLDEPSNDLDVETLRALEESSNVRAPQGSSPPSLRANPP